MPFKRAVACRRCDFIADCCGPGALVHRGGDCRRVRLSAWQACSGISSPEFVVWLSCAARLYAADSAALWMNVIHLSSPCMVIPATSAGVLLPMSRWGRKKCNCSPHIIRQTINVSSIGRRLDTKLHEQMKICVNSMLCLMARPQIHLPNVKMCLDVVNTYYHCSTELALVTGL